MTELGRHEDDRGVIQDLLAEVLTSVTEIFTRKGAVRGNHVHYLTAQWTYVVSGRLLAVKRTWDGVSPCLDQVVAGPGDLVFEPAGIAHAWQALEDTTVLVFTRGPRSGKNYESDVERLAPADRLIQP